MTAKFDDLAAATRVNARPPAVDEWVSLLEREGFAVEWRDRRPMRLLDPTRLVADETAAIEAAVAALLDDGVDVVLTTGGTGLTPDDVTVDAIEPLFDRPIPGFGELFRWLSYEEVGAMAMASRATAGVVDDRLVFCLPGSENAARTGAERLVAPAVGHLLGLVRR